MLIESKNSFGGSGGGGAFIASNGNTTMTADAIISAGVNAFAITGNDGIDRTSRVDFSQGVVLQYNIGTTFFSRLRLDDDDSFPYWRFSDGTNQARVYMKTYGLEYLADYHLSFTDRSLVDKAFVWPTVGTFILTGDVTGDLAAHTFVLGNMASSYVTTSSILFATKITDGVTNSGISNDAEQAQMSSNNEAATSFNQIRVNQNGGLVTLATGKTFEGSGDQSASYTANSYVQKSYADGIVAGKISGALTSTRIPVANGASSVADYSTLTFNTTGNILQVNGTYFSQSGTRNNFWNYTGIPAGIVGGASDNLGIGFSALNSITSGAANAAFGTNAGAACTIGSNNTFFSPGAGASVTDATSSVFIGTNAGGTANPSYSILIGSLSNNGNILSTAIQNILLGYAVAPVSNQNGYISIGNAIFANGATSLGSTPGGRVGIGTNSPVVSALLDLTSTTQGFLPPRMTTVQRNAISSPAEGLMVYDTDIKGWFGFNGTIWTQL